MSYLIDLPYDGLEVSLFSKAVFEYGIERSADFKRRAIGGGAWVPLTLDNAKAVLELDNWVSLHAKLEQTTVRESGIPGGAKYEVLIDFAHAVALRLQGSVAYVTLAEQ